MRGDSLHVDGSLGITLETLSAIPRLMGSKLETLAITDVPKFSDKAFASMVKRLPSLRVLNLRYAFMKLDIPLSDLALGIARKFPR